MEIEGKNESEEKQQRSTPDRRGLDLKYVVRDFQIDCREAMFSSRQQVTQRKRRLRIFFSENERQKKTHVFLYWNAMRECFIIHKLLVVCTCCDRWQITKEKGKLSCVSPRSIDWKKQHISNSRVMWWNKWKSKALVTPSNKKKKWATEAQETNEFAYAALSIQMLRYDIHWSSCRFDEIPFWRNNTMKEKEQQKQKGRKMTKADANHLSSPCSEGVQHEYNNLLTAC